MPTNNANNLGFTVFLSIIIDGKDNAVTPIMKLRTVPMPTPFENSASAIGIVPKISAYIGIPTIVANNTENGLFAPIMFCIISVGIQL